MPDVTLEQLDQRVSAIEWRLKMVPEPASAPPVEQGEVDWPTDPTSDTVMWMRLDRWYRVRKTENVGLEVLTHSSGVWEDYSYHFLRGKWRMWRRVSAPAVPAAEQEPKAVDDAYILAHVIGTHGLTCLYPNTSTKRPVRWYDASGAYVQSTDIDAIDREASRGFACDLYDADLASSTDPVDEKGE